MSKFELDARKKSDELWCSVIAMRFNDNACRPSFNLNNLYPAIDPSRPPSVPRNGSFLKMNFDYFRIAAVVLFDRFKNSGQNICNSSCLMEGGNNSESEAGMRVVIGAAIIGLGMSSEDVLFLNRTSRRMSVTENVSCERGMGAEVDVDSRSLQPVVAMGARLTSRRTSRRNSMDP